jgi:D-alanine--poly(phosphoribitol) ligase subunit 1
MMNVWRRILRHAEATPDATAVLGRRSVDYRRLVSMVRELAERLGSCGPGDVVALQLPTSEQALLAMLAVRSLGAAFLPVDITAPSTRQDYVIGESGAGLVVALEPGRADTLSIRIPSTARAQSVPEDTAYLMFTSGSTGTPKGVLISEEALADRLAGLTEVPGAAAGATFLALTSLSFDISLAELLLPLTVGGTVALAPAEARVSSAALSAAIEYCRPDVLQGTPSFWHLMLDTGWVGAPDSVVWCGGEALTADLARRLRPLCAELWNLYGPTEATIWATAWRCEADGPVALGDPLSGTECVLIDEGGAIVTGPGAEGEVVLLGAGLATGYLGGVLADRFAPLPRRSERAYRTGDRARYREDGSLAYLGRTDGQVKYRGQRIELGEIESILELHPAVSQAVVVLCHAGDPYRARLAAAVCAAVDTEPVRLRGWLAERLAPSMVPQSISVFESLPRSAAGKLDRPTIRATLESPGCS